MIIITLFRQTTMELDKTMEIGFSNLSLQYFQNIPILWKRSYFSSDRTCINYSLVSWWPSVSPWLEPPSVDWPVWGYCSPAWFPPPTGAVVALHHGESGSVSRATAPPTAQWFVVVPEQSPVVLWLTLGCGISETPQLCGNNFAGSCLVLICQPLHWLIDIRVDCH